MNRLMFLRTSILAAIGLALCLWVPETSTGFRPGARRPTVTPQGPSSGAPHWDHGQPRPGPGFSIGPQILIPLRRPAPPPDEQVAEPEDEETVEQEPPKKHVRRVKKRPLVKLAKQRVPYLRELAMDIEPSLIAMVRRHPRK